MINKNRKQIIITIVGVIILLIALIGASYAYFTSNISSTGDNNIDATTVVLASARMDYGDKVVANGILPGNKILKTITVTGSGPDNAEPITATIILTPDVTDFGTHVKYTIYAVENSVIDASTICEGHKPTTENGMYYDAMECDTTELGTPIISGTFEGKKTVTKEIEVTSTTNTTYYLLIEYVNDPNGQDEEQGKTFTINIDFRATYEGSNITQTFIVDGEEVYDLPSKQEYYEVAVTCSDNIERTWNYEIWSLNIEEDLEESCTCTLSFKTNQAFAFLSNLAKTSEELAYDETVDNNLRYIGANPNNYVLFNNELWRIIGVMNNITDSEGNIGNHIKIIRNESIGNYYWSGSSSNQSNDWTKSTLNTQILNGTYYNGLALDAKNIISDVVWNLGGDTNIVSASAFYTSERGINVYTGRLTEWTGKIGLMYPSDYGYAVGSNARNTCLNMNLNYSMIDCHINDWLYTNEDQWTLMPDSSFAYYAFVINSRGNVATNLNVRYFNFAVRPTIYLNSSIQIISDSAHNGSQEKPFDLKMEN